MCVRPPGTVGATWWGGPNGFYTLSAAPWVGALRGKKDQPIGMDSAGRGV